MGAVSALLRLVGVAFAFLRYGVVSAAGDAPYAPPTLTLAGRLTRPFAASKWRAKGPGARLAAALEALGPAYVKLGQLLATRPDIVGVRVAGELSALQDRLTPFPEETAQRIVADSLGQPVADVFETFGPPVAAASVAQVHRARLKDGTDVAVKILRPGIRARCAREMRSLFVGARLVERLSKTSRRLEPVKLIETLDASLRLELDLRLEAAGASEISDASTGSGQLRVPEMHWSYARSDVIVMEWIEGDRIDDLAALDARGVDRKALADAVMRGFLDLALNHGCFHADMHQGNLFVDKSGRLAAVDFGIIGRLDKGAQRYLAEILFGFLNRDYPRIAEVHFEAGYVPKRHSVAAFAQALRAVGEPLFGRNASAIAMSSVLMQLFEVTDLFDMRLRPELVLLQKTMVAVEGVCRQLDPEHNMWRASRPIVEAWMTDRLGPPAHLRAVGDNAVTVGRALQNLPEMLRKAELAADVISEDGLRVDGASIQALSEAQAKGAAATRRAVWAATAAVAALALTQIL
ncbi:MAG: 2-polyprenylphenol 6-hydroxylase [Pseudomonadota bacterium]